MAVCDKSKLPATAEVGGMAVEEITMEIDDSTETLFREMDIAVICGWTNP